MSTAQGIVGRFRGRVGFIKLLRTTSASVVLAPVTVALIQQMARQNRLWSAERIRGELLKLGVRVGERTVQRYMRGARSPHHSGQT